MFGILFQTFLDYDKDSAGSMTSSVVSLHRVSLLTYTQDSTVYAFPHVCPES